MTDIKKEAEHKYREVSEKSLRQHIVIYSLPCQCVFLTKKWLGVRSESMQVEVRQVPQG